MVRTRTLEEVLVMVKNYKGGSHLRARVQEDWKAGRKAGAATVAVAASQAAPDIRYDGPPTVNGGPADGEHTAAVAAAVAATAAATAGGQVLATGGGTKAAKAPAGTEKAGVDAPWTEVGGILSGYGIRNASKARDSQEGREEGGRRFVGVIAVLAHATIPSPLL